jgi:transketolase N-terminal domain/subunit/GDP-D-mannose dehydratase
LVYETPFIEKKKILITGGGGFVGANLTKALIEKGHEVSLILRKQTDNWRIRDILSKIRIYYADLSDKEALKEIINHCQPNLIYHLATYGAYPEKQKEVNLMIQNNLQGTLNLIEIANGIAIINTGSTSEYGIKDAPMKENDLCLPDNDYGWTKLSQTKYCQKKGIPTLRLFSVYGPLEAPGRLIPVLIKSKIKGSPLKLIDSVRDYVYVEDVVNAFILAGENYEKIKGEIINIGSGTQTSVKDLLSIMHNINPRVSQIDWNFEQIQTEPKTWVSDINKAKEILGWKPSHNLQSGLEKTYSWWESRETVVIESLKRKSEELRQKTIEFHRKTKVPHIGCDMSIIEILTTLYYEIMKKDDSFILSKGHASGALYVTLNDKKIIPDEELFNLEEHPTLNKKYHIEATTGSLGHGLSIGVGMALANQKSKVYVLMGDGECDEGQVWEAIRSASELKLNNLIVIIDCNGFQGFKETNILVLKEKFSAFGAKTVWCDGHNCENLLNELSKPQDKPLVILAKTIKGKGIKEMENKLESHYLKF